MIALGGTDIVKAYLGSTELKNIAIGDKLLLSSEEPLPEGAVRVKYLASTGTQYINTGIVGSSDYTYYVKFKTDAYCGYIFGARTAANNRETGFLFGSNDTLQSRIWGYSYETDATPFYGKWLNVSFYRGRLKDLDTNTNIISNIYNGVFTNYNIFLFGTNTYNTPTINSNSPRYIEYFKIVNQNGVALRDYIAVRKGATGYMYDKVSQTFFANAGTGDFVVGDDV